MKRLYLASLLATASGFAMAAPSAQAQTGDAYYDIAAQRLDDALREYSRVSGRDVIAASSLLAGRRGTAVRGRLAPDAALDRLLSDTGLIAERVEGTLVLRERGDGTIAAAGAPTGATAQAVNLATADAIVVTGTRIRGTGPVGSPVATIDRETLDRSGRATLADFIQTIPQNFSGGPAEANIGTSARGNAASNIG